MHIYMHPAGKGRGLLCIYIYASRAERVKLVRENPIVVSNVAELAIAIDYEEPF